MGIMHDPNNIQPSDLSLLPILEALIEERHVSRATLRLNRSQPAVSHALARLRDMFDDPLLVRGEGGLQPTARALQLAEPLGEALALMRSMVGQPSFDMVQCQRQFRLSLSDYGATILLPALVARLRKSAPLLDLTVVSYGRERALAALMDGEIDLAVGVYPMLKQASHRDLKSTVLFEETFACLFEQSDGRKALSLKDYLARPHVRVSVALQDNSDWPRTPHCNPNTALVCCARSRQGKRSRLDSSKTQHRAFGEGQPPMRRTAVPAQQLSIRPGMASASRKGSGASVASGGNRCHSGQGTDVDTGPTGRRLLRYPCGGGALDLRDDDMMATVRAMEERTALLLAEIGFDRSRLLKSALGSTRILLFAHADALLVPHS